MFLDDIVNPLNKEQLKDYIRANAADAVRRDSFKSGAAGDRYKLDKLAKEETETGVAGKDLDEYIQRRRDTNYSEFPAGARVTHTMMGDHVGRVVDAKNIPIEDRRDSGVPVQFGNRIYWMSPSGLKKMQPSMSEGVAEGYNTITEYRDRMYQYIKSIVPTWPDYVVQDWLYKGRGKANDFNTNSKAIKDDIIEMITGAGLSANTKWQLVPNMKFTMAMFDPMTKQRLIGRAGGTSDLGMGIPKDKERHATQASLAQQQGGVRKEPVLLIKTAKGYELLEGWHRTIQHFAQYPNGYTGPAYVAVAQGQQGVAEEGYGTHPSQRVDPRTGKKYVPPKSPLGKGVAEGSLELNTPDPVVVIQDLKGNMLDKLNLSVASQKYKLGNPQNIKNQLAHQNYTTVGSYVIVSPMGGQPQDKTTQGVAEGVTEGVNDPHIFKCIFLFGPMGAGKSTVARPLLSHTGLRSVNLDNFNEMFIKKGQVPTGHLAPDQLERSWQLTQTQQQNFIDGRLGVIIDGSGRNPDTAIGVIEKLQPLGYEFMMIFVNVSEATSIARQQSRAEKQKQQWGAGRQVDPTLAKNTYAQVQKMLGKYSAFFGPQRFVYVDNENTPNLAQATKQVDAFLRAPVTQPEAIEWIQSQKGGEQVAQKQQKLATAQDSQQKALKQYNPLNPKFWKTDSQGKKQFTDPDQQGVAEAEGVGKQLSVQQLAAKSDEALDNAYHYGRSTPGNTFGWQANLASAAYAKEIIDSGETDINKISDAVHKGWWSVAQKFVDDPDQFSDTEALRAKGKFDKKMADRIAQMVPFNQLTPDQQKIDSVVAKALLQAITGGGEQGVAEAAKHGLYYNVNKRKAAGTSRPASSPTAPTAQAWKDAAKTAKKEGVAEGGYNDHDNNREGFGKRPRKDDEYHVPDPVETKYNIKVNGAVINHTPFANRDAALTWAKQAVATGKLDPKNAVLSPINQVNELTDKLADYKTAAAADAAAADKRGDYKRGDRRFRGINQATKKQFANDLKGHKKDVKEGIDDASPVTGAITRRKMELGESYWNKLQYERNTKIASLITELTESIKDIK